MRMREVCEYCEICVRKRRHLSFAEKERRTNAPSQRRKAHTESDDDYGLFPERDKQDPTILHFLISFFPLSPLKFARRGKKHPPSLPPMKKEEPPARRTENRVSTAAEKGNELVEK